MNLERHQEAHLRYLQHLMRGDGDSADKHLEFYDEYLSVLDLTEEFYLQTIDMVFQRYLLPKCLLEHRGRPVRPERIKDIGLLTVEGENDDISGIGQTQAAHQLCSGLGLGVHALVVLLAPLITRRAVDAVQTRVGATWCCHKFGRRSERRLPVEDDPVVSTDDHCRAGHGPRLHQLVLDAQLCKAIGEETVGPANALAASGHTPLNVIGTGWSSYRDAIARILPSPPRWAEGDRYPQAADIARLATWFLGRTPLATLGNIGVLLIAAVVTAYGTEAMTALLATVFGMLLLGSSSKMIALVRKDFIAA